MKHKRLLWCGVVIVLVSALLVGACAKPAPAEPIKIGCILDLTGFLAPLGDEEQKGALVAFEKAGYEVAGRPIELIIEDGASATTTTMDKARKVVEADKVSLIIGPIMSGAAVGMAGYLDRVKVPNLAIAYHPDALPLEHHYMWLTAGGLRQGTYAAGIYAYDKLGYRTATTLAQDYVAGREFIAGFVQGFEERGGKVIQQQWYPEGTKDFTPYFIALKEADCYVPWFAGAPAFAGFPQYRELGIKMPIICPEDGGIVLSPPCMKDLGDTIVGVTVTALYCYTVDTPGNKEFVQAYQDRWDGALPGPMAGATYASAQVALEALRIAGGDTSPEAVHKALGKVSVDTVRGHISFNPDRVAVFTCFVVKVDENLVPRVVGEYVVRGDRVGDEMVVSLAE